ncbi:uncharacterized protein LOC130084975 [Rhinichthys klamathensis goyatoka]|uniref:uncharacterized protein LOC130084975 n=1 Tax=Rhinichthys klamathensis goyatoka TaxID=3034132 RepID=UPI0024B588C3|nr:uncharacterized protein LOC130084975 [Rhinichthys klamathensis goyatoka]
MNNNRKMMWTTLCKQGDKQTDIQDQELYEDCTLQDDNDDEDFELFLSASDSESSDEDGYYDQADSFMEEDQLEETDIFGEENMDADGFRVTEDSPEHLMLKLLAFMLLTWQAVFKISDRAIFALLQCIRQLIWLMGHILCVNTLCGLAGKIPKTLYSLRKWTNICRDSFSQFVVCPKCMVTYTIEESYTTSRSGAKIINTCSSRPFHKHPQKKLRSKCGTPLMRKLIGSSGKEYLYPIRVYCYKKVSQSLETLVRRSGFLEKCEQWRHRSMPHSVMGDVYDGKIWQDFQYVNGQPFLSEPNNFALMMNVDWYQPYKHSPYSVGVIYLVVLNLPREERFKDENMILVGVIPGPKEPKLNMIAYLEPLVDDLRELWEGVVLMDSSPLGCQVYRAALLCLSSDIPASRKCGGFVGHGALRGCNKCLKKFTKTSFGGKTDFSGFDRSTWTLRTSEEHKRFAKMTEKATTKAAQKKLEAQYGAGWSELFFLPYYDAIQFVVIDPMHNLLLGTARHVFKLWIECGVLSIQKLEELQKRMDSLKVPQDVGRIPLRIASGFSGFTADQWKNWTTIYSLFCLKGLIEDPDYDMWFDFVQACIIMCSRVISHDRLEVADCYLQTFLLKFVELYGSLHCTPNMHLHLHLKECLLDYGPVLLVFLI